MGYFRVEIGQDGESPGYSHLFQGFEQFVILPIGTDSPDVEEYEVAFRIIE